MKVYVAEARVVIVTTNDENPDIQYRITTALNTIKGGYEPQVTKISVVWRDDDVLVE